MEGMQVPYTLLRVLAPGSTVFAPLVCRRGCGSLRFCRLTPAHMLIHTCTMQDLADAGVVFSDLAFAEGVVEEEEINEDNEQESMRRTRGRGRGRGRGRERRGRDREQQEERGGESGARRGRKKKSRARSSPYAPD